MDTFRYDVNALRALAIAGVVAFHFGLGFSGGFAGVDVFFVVSGFLMTRIIGRRLDTDRFSLLAFYAARARRIIPALVVVVLAVGGAAVLLMNPLHLTTIARDCIASLLFFSNHLYLQQGGYFAAAINQNWLLHTWSLSLEWQFYLFFPILLIALKRLGLSHRGTSAILIVLALLSFAEMLRSHDASVKDLNTAFYTLPARTWEFMIGALCAMARPLASLPESWRRIAHYAGVTMIFIAMACLSSGGWPSFLTSVPVLGTALVLLSNCQEEIWTRAKPTRLIGLWSYSVYLWHWPIAAMGSYFALASMPLRIGGVVVSVVLGALSYRYVETQATSFVWATRDRLFKIAGPALTLPLLLAFATLETHGFENIRYANQPQLRAELAEYRAAIDDWHYRESCDRLELASPGSEICSIGDPAARDVLVIGDSFAQQLTPRYAGAFVGTTAGITFFTRTQCAPLPNVDRKFTGAGCARWVEQAFAYAESQQFKRVVFVSFWPERIRDWVCFINEPRCGDELSQPAFDRAFEASYDRMAERWRRLKSQGKEVFVLEIMPKGGGDPAALYLKAVAGQRRSSDLDYATFKSSRSEMHARFARVAAASGAILVEPSNFLCADGKCPLIVNGHPFYKDEWHLRAAAVKGAAFSFLDDYLLPRPRMAQALQ